MTSIGSERTRDARPARMRSALLLAAGALMLAAITLPVWGMTLVSVQYPEGLRMVVYPLRMTGDLAEINALNRYIGMAPISSDYFDELRVIAGLFALTALACGVAAVVQRRWRALVPLALMSGTAIYGIWRMRSRLYQYGHELDPMAPIDIEPFTPPMFGENQIAQFGTYAYFSWGALLPLVAAALVCAVIWLDRRHRGPAGTSAESERVPPSQYTDRGSDGSVHGREQRGRKTG